VGQREREAKENGGGGGEREMYSQELAHIITEAEWSPEICRQKAGHPKVQMVSVIVQTLRPENQVNLWWEFWSDSKD
jgi:hypothetical protein